MNRFRVSSCLLICASLLTVAACGTDAKDTPGGTGTTAAAAPATGAPFSAAAENPGAPDDKQICESVKTTGEGLKASLIEAVQSGKEPSGDVLKKILTNTGAEMKSLASDAKDTEVVTALKAFGAEATKAAAAADPAAAASTPTFEKTAAAVTAACKPTGVDVNF